MLMFVGLMQVVPCDVLQSQVDYFISLHGQNASTSPEHMVSINVPVHHEGWSTDRVPTWSRVTDTAAITILVDPGANGPWMRVDWYHTTVSWSTTGHHRC